MNRMQPYCSHDCGETDSTKRRKLKRLNVIVISWRIEFIYRIRVLEFQNLDFSDNSRCIRKCFNEKFNDFNWDLLLSDLQLKIDTKHRRLIHFHISFLEDIYRNVIIYVLSSIILKKFSSNNKSPSLPNLLPLAITRVYSRVSRSQSGTKKEFLAARNKISDTTFSIFRSNHQSHSSGDISVPRKSSVWKLNDKAPTTKMYPSANLDPAWPNLEEKKKKRGKKE